MINKIIEMLLLSDFYGESENIDIAKGKYKFTTSIKEQYKQALRRNLRKKIKDEKTLFSKNNLIV